MKNKEKIDLLFNNDIECRRDKWPSGVIYIHTFIKVILFYIFVRSEKEVKMKKKSEDEWKIKKQLLIFFSNFKTITTSYL